VEHHHPRRLSPGHLSEERGDPRRHAAVRERDFATGMTRRKPESVVAHRRKAEAYETVPGCARGLNGSYVELPSRNRWLSLAPELKVMCDEAVRRRAQKLVARGASARAASASAGGALYEAYIRDRLDLDDPLEGVCVRDVGTGRLQGFLTRTTFTTWTPHFAWDSRHHASGLKGLAGSGRKLDACGPPSKPPASSSSSSSETAVESASKGVGLDRARSRVLNVVVDDHAGHHATTDTSDSSLAAELEAQPRSGDWRTTGIVWPTVAEIALLASLGGCGDWLVALALAELARDESYEYCVVCATPGAATFYERHGFVRVGAVAKYMDPGTRDDATCKKPWQAYRHWAWGDERRDSLRLNHGEPSYMMAKRLRPATQSSQAAAADRRRRNALLAKRDRLASLAPTSSALLRRKRASGLRFPQPPPPQPPPAKKAKTTKPAAAPAPPSSRRSTTTTTTTSSRSSSRSSSHRRTTGETPTTTTRRAPSTAAKPSSSGKPAREGHHQQQQTRRSATGRRLRGAPGAALTVTVGPPDTTACEVVTASSQAGSTDDDDDDDDDNASDDSDYEEEAAAPTTATTTRAPSKRTLGATRARRAERRALQKDLGRPPLKVIVRLPRRTPPPSEHHHQQQRSVPLVRRSSRRTTSTGPPAAGGHEVVSSSSSSSSSSTPTRHWEAVPVADASP